MADNQKATTDVLYSWDEGLTWENFQLISPTKIKNIIIEPGNTSEKFVIYGSRSGKAVTITVDFSNIH